MNTSRWATKSADPTPQPAAEAATLPEHENVAQASQAVLSYSADDPIDEFAQTRPPDDLFDDDFTPLDQPAPPEPAEAVPTALATVSPSQTTSTITPLASRAPRVPRRGGVASRGPPPTTRTQDGVNDNETTSEDASASAQPRPERREAAVRGDRSGTGGLKREKLTEEELTAKLEAMKIMNASLMEKHARSQADEESFYAREALAAQRRKEERVNRQQMMGERERNRLRKLQAQGGREWDMEKDEKEFAATEGRKARRGAFGGITSERQTIAGSPDTSSNRPANTGPRGRGGRRGRGGFSENKSREQSVVKSSEGQNPPSAADFPELPATAKVPQSSKAGPVTLEFPGKKSEPNTGATKTLDAPSAGQKTSWADEVEAS